MGFEWLLQQFVNSKNVKNIKSCPRDDRTGLGLSKKYFLDQNIQPFVKSFPIFFMICWLHDSMGHFIWFCLTSSSGPWHQVQVLRRFAWHQEKPDELIHWIMSPTSPKQKLEMISKWLNILILKLYIFYFFNVLSFRHLMAKSHKSK